MRLGWRGREDRFAWMMEAAGFEKEDWIVEFPRFVPPEVRELPYWRGKDCYQAYHTLKNPAQPYHCSIKLEEAAGLYGLVRMMQPEMVVESGCNNGCSSSAIALALRDNGHGHFKTCDLDANWVAKTKRRLLAVLDADQFEVRQCEGKDLLLSVGDLDLFWHDSYHTEAVVVPEIDAAMKSLRPGGLMAFHDVNMVYEPGAETNEMVRVLTEQSARYGLQVIRGMSNPGIAILQRGIA